MELVTVLCSNLSGDDNYLQEYFLEHPDPTIISAIKIGLRYYTTDDLILQLNMLKNHL